MFQAVLTGTVFFHAQSALKPRPERDGDFPSCFGLDELEDSKMGRIQAHNSFIV